MSNIVVGKYITAPPERGADGVGLCDGEHWEYRHCYIDMRDVAIADMDEAIGCTWGSSATFENCVIRGAAKLILCGCGDSPDDPLVQAEKGKRVIFRNCLLLDFARRGPEVQDGMIVTLLHCLIAWGCPDRFADGGFWRWLKLPWKDEHKWQRVFGAWAHNGGSVYASDCLFMPTVDAPLWQRIVSRISHFGQAVNERGWRGIFHRDAWLSGYKRALTAGPDGYVRARHCYAPKGYVIDNHTDPMTEEGAVKLLHRLEMMALHMMRVCK